MFKTHAVAVDYKPNEWVLVQPLVWEADARYTVPARFITDLASVPPALRALSGFNPTGLSRRPAILHDYLYCSGVTGSRKAADRVFYEALLSVGVSRTVARLHWLGVRVGGAGYWAKRCADDGTMEREDYVSEQELAELTGMLRLVS